MLHGLGSVCRRKAAAAKAAEVAAAVAASRAAAVTSVGRLTKGSADDPSFQLFVEGTYRERMTKVLRQAASAAGVSSADSGSAPAVLGAVAGSTSAAHAQPQPGKRLSGMVDAGAAAAGSKSEAEDESDAGPLGEYDPAVEVVNDVYEVVMGVRLPQRALYGARAEALRVLEPAAVRRQCRWAVGRRTALKGGKLKGHLVSARREACAHGLSVSGRLPRPAGTGSRCAARITRSPSTPSEPAPAHQLIVSHM